MKMLGDNINFAIFTSAVLLSGCGGGGARQEPEPTSVLNDTGRVLCSGSAEADAKVACPVPGAPGQDAEYGRDYSARIGALTKVGGGDGGFDFSKLGDGGMPLLVQDQQWDPEGTAEAGTLWNCVRDNVTGLTWEVKHTHPAHPRYGLSTYNWYSSDPRVNGGLAGEMDLGDCNAGRCDSEGYVDYINSIALCGYTDWRMPSVSEFYSIGHQGREDPAIDERYFPNTLGALRYWSANAVVNVPPIAWYMYFSDASISYTSKNNTSYLRLVRSDGGAE